MSYVVNGEVRISLVAEGDLTNVVNVQNLIINNQDRMTEGQKESNQQTQQGTYLVRRLALDLRMISIGLGILRREFAGINPLFDSFAGGLQIASATAMAAVGAIMIVSDVSKLLKNETTGLGLAIKELAGVAVAGGVGFAGLGAAAMALAVALAVLAGIVAAVMIFENVSGITKYRTEITRLNEDLTTLNSSMRNIGVEQSALNAESAAYAAQIAVVNRQIEIQGYATAEQTAQLKSLESAQSDVGTRQAMGNAEAARGKFETDQLTDSVKDYEEAIAREYTGLVKGIITPNQGPSLGGGVPEEQLGGEVAKTGIVRVERGEVIMQKEQYASMLTSGGGSSYQISISLAGANIRSDVDLENALTKGGKAAADEIRLLEMRRRKVTTKF